MNKNMPNYDREKMVHLMNGAGLTEEEKENYPLKCPHCLGVPDGTRYCPYCGGKLV
jgi:DNA-directed RNA polymerase subunit RPC12/RpoP